MSKIYIATGDFRKSKKIPVLEFEKYLYIIFEYKINKKYIIKLCNNQDVFTYCIDIYDITLLPKSHNIYYYAIPLIDLIVSNNNYYDEWKISVSNKDEKIRFTKDIFIIKKNFYYNYIDYHKGSYVNLNI